jgi:hypothetical protein
MFRLPSFNLTCDIFDHALPPPNAPRIAGQICQLRAPGKQTVLQVQYFGVYLPCWELLLPAQVDIRDLFTSTSFDFVTVPAGTARLYQVEWVDDVARGFSNEYRIAYVYKVANWPHPIP